MPLFAVIAGKRIDKEETLLVCVGAKSYRVQVEETVCATGVSERVGFYRKMKSTGSIA